jgi:glycosyltransferase involved in cell wall biosynthesis
LREPKCCAIKVRTVSKKDFISVVIPVFNEEHTIGNIITRTKDTMNKLNMPYEMLVIDDGSIDKSLEISKNEGAEAFRETHRGKGHAIRAGFQRAKGNIIVTLDSDGSHRPEEIPIVLESVIDGKADLSIGSRFSNSNLDLKGIPRINRLGNRTFNRLIGFLTGANVSDSQSGFRAVKSTVVAKLNLDSHGYEVESEMLIKAWKKGARIAEIPISFDQRTVGKSRLDPLKDGMRILYSIIKSYLL